MSARSGRTFEHTVTAVAKKRDDGKIELLAPLVGLWRDHPVKGTIVSAGYGIGEIETLGLMHRIEVPSGAAGLVCEVGGPSGLARRPVGFGALLAVLDPSASAELGIAVATAEASAPTVEGAFVFSSPSSGRYYGRPGPDKAAFVSVGDEIVLGHTICLLEVMKTFNRVNYGGQGAPARGRVVAIRVREEDDLAAGDPILDIEPLA